LHFPSDAASPKPCIHFREVKGTQDVMNYFLNYFLDRPILSLYSVYKIQYIAGFLINSTGKRR
jgi:hypothetical protein